jgi:hypothetical protein
MSIVGPFTNAVAMVREGNTAPVEGRRARM